MSDTFFTISTIKEIVKPIVMKYNVEEIYWFGSYARSEATKYSDLDFIVFGGKTSSLQLSLR